MESTYRPQSPDLSSYAPQSPDLSGYRPHSPDLSAPIPSPRFGGLNQHQQYQRQQYQNGYGNAFGGNAFGYSPTSIPQEQLAYGQQFTPQQNPAQQYTMPVSTRRMNIKREQENGADQNIPDPMTYQQQPQVQHLQQQQPPPPQSFQTYTNNSYPQPQLQQQCQPPPHQPLPPPPADLHTELSAPLQKMKTENFKSHIKTEGGPSDATNGVDLKTSFPVARIKRIMQADEDIGKVAQVTPHVVSRALELFMIKLVSGAAQQARGQGGAGGGGAQKGGKRILCQHMKKAVNADTTFDFLAEIVGKVPDAPPPKAKKEVGSDSEEGVKPKKRSRKRKDSEDEA